MSNFNIQLIDYLAPDAPSRFASSLHETGFAVLKNHPIDANAIDAMYRGWEKFFDADDKFGFATEQDVMHGYYSYKSENAKGNDYKDLKEFYHVYEGDPVPPGIGDMTREFHVELMQVGSRLLHWLDENSPLGITRDLSEPLVNMVDGSERNLLRILHYPPLGDDVHPREQRAAPHEDINLITLLVSGSQPGLEACDAQGNWHVVPCNAGMITVNAGDMLARATGGFYPATTHRVVNPDCSEHSDNVSRYSMPMFVHPRPEVLLAPDQTAGEYLSERLHEIGLK